MEEGVFHLHKWHSNLLELEGHQRLKEDVPLKQVRVKLEMGTSPKEAKILGDPWNNTEDELSIGFMKLLESVAEGPLTKRKLLSAVNGVYNPLGLTSPALITGKILCSETSLHKLKWDERVSTQRRRQRCNKNCPSPLCRCQKASSFGSYLHCSISCECTSLQQSPCCRVKNSSKKSINPRLEVIAVLPKQINSRH